MYFKALAGTGFFALKALPTLPNFGTGGFSHT